MNPTGWIILSTVLILVVLTLIPEPRPVPTLLALRAAHTRRAVREVRPWTVLGPFGAIAVGVWPALQWGPALGAAAVTLYGIAAWALSIRARSSRRANHTERMARFAVVLANQAITATTLGEALTRAAPLVTGNVGVAARKLADGYAQGALADSAREFVQTVPVTSSIWLTDMLAVTGKRGSRVSDALTALEDLAATEADSARYFHRRVAAQMTPLTIALSLSIATVVGMAVWMPAFGVWLVSPGGQLVALGASLACALICAPAFALAGSMVRT